MTMNDLKVSQIEGWPASEKAQKPHVNHNFRIHHELDDLINGRTDKTWMIQEASLKQEGSVITF